LAGREQLSHDARDPFRTRGQLAAPGARMSKAALAAEDDKGAAAEAL